MCVFQAVTNRGPIIRVHAGADYVFIYALIFVHEEWVSSLNSLMILGSNHHLFSPCAVARQPVVVTTFVNQVTKGRSTMLINCWVYPTSVVK